MEIQNAVKAVEQHIVYRLKAQNLETSDLEKSSLRKSIKEKLNELVEEYETTLREIELDEE